MRRFLLLCFVLVFGFILLNRERVFVRDPLAKVTVNGEKSSDFDVYINYSNDVLLERGTPAVYGILVQGWNRIPGTPAKLKCIQWMACLTDADHATALPLDHAGPGPYDPRTSMTSTEVAFVDGEGRTVHVALR